MRSACNDHEMSLASAISQTRAGPAASYAVSVQSVPSGGCDVRVHVRERAQPAAPAAGSGSRGGVGRGLALARRDCGRLRHRGGRHARLHVVAGLRQPEVAEPVAQGQQRQAQADLHRDARRHPGQDPGAPRRQGLRHHHLLPGLQAALRRAQDPGADGREEAPQPQGDAAVLPQQLPRLLGQERRPHGGADVLGRARTRLRLEGHRRPDVVRDAVREVDEGQGHDRRRSGRRLHAGRARPRHQRRRR